MKEYKIKEIKKKEKIIEEIMFNKFAFTNGLQP